MLTFDSETGTLVSEDANEDVTTFKFGKKGEFSFKDSGGNIYASEVDNEQRVTKHNYPDGSRVELSYAGSDSQLLSEVVRRSGAHIKYTYDDQSNLVSDIGC